MKKREIRVTNGEKREKGCKVERERGKKRGRKNYLVSNTRERGEKCKSLAASP